MHELMRFIHNNEIVRLRRGHSKLLRGAICIRKHSETESFAYLSAEVNMQILASEVVASAILVPIRNTYEML